MSGGAMGWYWLRILAVLEIVGGIAGVLAVCAEVAQSDVPLGAICVGLAPITLFLLSLFAGVQLWHEKRTGYWASIVVQGFQFLKLRTASVAFMMSFGFDVMVLEVPSSGPAGYGLVFHAAVLEYHLWLRDGLGVDAGTGFSISSCVNICVLLWRLKKVEITGRLTQERTVAPRVTDSSDHPGWVMPFWMRVVGGFVLLIFAFCIGIRITLIPR